MSPEWVTAFSSITLVLVAVLLILRDEIRKWILQPTFEVRFQRENPDCHRVPLGSYPVHYIRCRIYNSGRVAAQNVEVAVVGVRKKDANGTFQNYPMATPWPLLWSHHNNHVLSQIPRLAERHITLGHVMEPKDRIHIPVPSENDPKHSQTDTLFVLEVFVRSNTLEYLLPPGEYEIKVQVAASNAKPKTFLFHLNHTGKWFSDESKMYSDGLGLNITQQ